MSEPRIGKKSLLIADDEAEIRNVLRDCLCKSYECEAVGSAEEVLGLLQSRKFDLILSDIMMDGMSGLEMVPQVLSRAPETVIVMISGAQTIESAIEALRVGAFDYIMKPFDLGHVELIVRRADEHHELLQARQRYENYLEDLIRQRTSELNRALKTVEDSYRTTLKALAAALETRDRETHGHSERVVNFSLRLGRELGLDDEQLRSLEFGALLHDIGKIGIPDQILRKPAPLTSEEWQQMRLHPSLGEQILRGIEFLEGAARVVGQHHEKWDGSGYPRGLSGEVIDLNARVFAVADAFDAITSNRVYRQGKPYAAAVVELETHAGCQFDPRIVAAFSRIPQEEWEHLRSQSLEKARERGRPDFAEDGHALSATLSSTINPLSALVSFAHRTS
jgi:response regulator RpfG family c-di-GMP phosphodiesterase